MQETAPFYIDFPFRGSRDYVHSTSIANYFAERFPRATRFELVIKEWMDSRITFRRVDKLGSIENGYIKLGMLDSEVLLQFSQDKTYPVNCRDQYDEAGLLEDSQIEDKVLTCNSVGSGTFFDRLIAANKLLINSSFGPKVKLIASKIVTLGFPDDGVRFSVALASYVGTRIFKSIISIDGAPVGEVIFYGE